MKTAIFLANGFEEIEALTVADLLRRVKIECDIVSSEEEIEVMGSHGICVKADRMISQMDFSEYECMVLPGGMPGTKGLESNQYLMSRLDEYIKADKLVCAICAAPTILGHKGYLNGKKAVCYPGLEGELAGAETPECEVVRDGNIITSRGLGTAIEFAAEIVKAATDESTAENLLKTIVYKQY